MEDIRHFLESSTIHGLTYISSTRKLVRLFWIFVVITGFSAASFMIYESFQAWEESPVSTNIETLPISRITFPKVTVCPPKDTITDLNYDIEKSKHVDVDKTTRNNLKKYAESLLLDHLHYVVMSNFSKIQEKNRYRNWYLGYTKIQGPVGYNGGDITSKCNWKQFDTSATKGEIFTEAFGNMFDVDKVEPDIKIEINIHPPQSVLAEQDVTLHFELEKVSMRNIIGGFEKYEEDNGSSIHPFSNNIYRNYSPPADYDEIMREFRILNFERLVPIEDLKKMEMPVMPGFKLKWHYTWGLAGEVQPDPKQHNDNNHVTKSFVRKLFEKYTFCNFFGETFLINKKFVSK